MQTKFQSHINTKSFALSIIGPNAMDIMKSGHPEGRCMPFKKHNKLVRVKIPDMIEKDRHKAKFETLLEKGHIAVLDKKLLKKSLYCSIDKKSS